MVLDAWAEAVAAAVAWATRGDGPTPAAAAAAAAAAAVVTRGDGPAPVASVGVAATRGDRLVPVGAGAGATRRRGIQGACDARAVAAVWHAGAASAAAWHGRSWPRRAAPGRARPLSGRSSDLPEMRLSTSRSRTACPCTMVPSSRASAARIASAVANSAAPRTGPNISAKLTSATPRKKSRTSCGTPAHVTTLCLCGCGRVCARLRTFQSAPAGSGSSSSRKGDCRRGGRPAMSGL
jgi:hypothetical protein